MATLTSPTATASAGPARFTGLWNCSRWDGSRECSRSAHAVPSQQASLAGVLNWLYEQTDPLALPNQRQVLVTMLSQVEREGTAREVLWIPAGTSFRHLLVEPAYPAE